MNEEKDILKKQDAPENRRTCHELTTHQMAAIALMTALMCILAPMSIPIGAVPISFTNFVIYIAIYILGTKLGTFSYCLYLLLGLVGLPVFSGYTGGISKLAGPTGGYLIGFIFMAVISGVFLQKAGQRIGLSLLGMVLGTAAAYFFGTVWFIFQTDSTLVYALTVCVFPFLIGDGVKIILASKLGPLLVRALQKARLLDHITS